MTILLDENHRVFVLGPNVRICKDAIKLYSPFAFSRMPAFLCEDRDWERMMGHERLHVIQLVSPARPFQFYSDLGRVEFHELARTVRQRWLLMSGRRESSGNMWIELNLP
jgi:hypothetical protein